MRVRNLGVMLVCLVTLALIGCESSKQTVRDPSPGNDPVMSLLNNGIAQLDININALSKRMDDVLKASVKVDATLQELQALDLSGWQLHREQWVLQRNHLLEARALIQQTSIIGNEKGQIVDQWHKHRNDYAEAIEQLHQQRHELEWKHFEVENRLIERRLQ